MWQAYNVTQHYLTESKNYQAHSEHKSTGICTPLPVTCYQRKILATQFCHWLIRDWISVLKFQRNPRQVLIIYQNINRLNRRYLHVLLSIIYHHILPYFKYLPYVTTERASSGKKSKAMTIVSVNFLMRPDGKKYLEVGKWGYHSPGLWQELGGHWQEPLLSLTAARLSLISLGCIPLWFCPLLASLKLISDIELTGAVYLLELQVLQIYLIFCLHLSLLRRKLL